MSRRDWLIVVALLALAAGWVRWQLHVMEVAPQAFERPER